MFKRIISYFLVIGLLLSLCCFKTFAITNNEISAPSAVLIDSTTNKILYEKNAHEKRPCASITKVMTLLLVMEAIENGKLRLNDNLKASAHAASMGGSDIWLEEGETMSVNDLLKATVVASANDAAVVLAEAVSGSEETFVAEMNKKAKSLGMNDTTFKNCNGLDEEGHITTAYDVALMSCALIKHKKIFDYTSIWIDNLRDGKTQIVNTNKLLRNYKGITGLKTGTTNNAGCCMSATATRDNLSLNAVVLGCSTGNQRFSDCATLLDYGFANYKMVNLNLPKQVYKSVEVSGGMTNSINLLCTKPEPLILQKSTNSKVKTKFIIKKDLKAPIHKGDNIGRVDYYINNNKVKTSIISSKNTVEQITFSRVFSSFVNSLMNI